MDAEWPDGATQHVDDFRSSSEAREWITKKSEAWLQEHPIAQAAKANFGPTPDPQGRTVHEAKAEVPVE